MILLYNIFYFVWSAIGAGAVKANMAVFGAEQSEELKVTSRYFDKYVVAVNIGSTIATLVIPPIENNPKDYFIGYIIAATTHVNAAILFGIGWRFYFHIEARETVIMKCIPVVRNAFQSWYKYKKIKHLIPTERYIFSRSSFLSASQSLTGEKEEAEEELIRGSRWTTTIKRFLILQKRPMVENFLIE